MALKEYQEALLVDKVYKLTQKGGVRGSELLDPSIYIAGGTVDLYGLDGATDPTLYTQMTVNAENAGITAKNVFAGLTNYIACKQITGTITSIVVTGFEVELVGDIS